MPRDMWYERKDGVCVVKFMHAPHRREWILGVNFFQNYYSVMDYENQRIGFAPSINFGKPGSRSFIRWALSFMHLKSMDVEMPSPTLSSEVLMATTMIALLMFVGYYLVINRKKQQKVKAVALEDDKLETLVNSDL